MRPRRERLGPLDLDTAVRAYCWANGLSQGVLIRRALREHLEAVGGVAPREDEAVPA